MGGQVSRGDDSADHWSATDTGLREVAAVMADAAVSHVHYMSPCEDTCTVDVPRILGCDVYSALQTDIHADEDFPRWTVLLVLRTNGHSVTVHDGGHTFVPAVGDLLLFDLHRDHVLDMPPHAFPENEELWFSKEHTERLCREYPFVCAHLDLDERPSRSRAEAAFAELLQPALESQGPKP